VTVKALSALQVFQAGYYHRVNRDVEAGAIATYSVKAPNNVALEVGAKTYLDAAAFLSACIPLCPVLIGANSELLLL
jgi:voltage-dependent anion channel protein 2